MGIQNLNIKEEKLEFKICILIIIKTPQVRNSGYKDMDFIEFMNKITEQIKEYLPEAFQNANISILKTKVNNDNTLLHGLSIKREVDLIVPNLYMDGLYKQYENGRSMESILSYIAKKYTSGRSDKYNNLEAWFSNYEKVKERLILQVVNKANNALLLERVSHKYLENVDLTAVYKVLLNTREHGSATIPVNNEHIECWGIDGNDLYQVALENTVRLRPAQIGNIEDVVTELMGEVETKDQEELSNYVIEPYNQYVLSNEQRLHGATSMLYPDVLQKLAENSDGNLFIMPSSTNEILLIKDDGKLTAAELQAIVVDTNRKYVEPEEFLSNEVFYYDREEQSLSIATDKEQTKELLERLGSKWGSDEMENEWEQEV